MKKIFFSAFIAAVFVIFSSCTGSENLNNIDIIDITDIANITEGEIEEMKSNIYPVMYWYGPPIMDEKAVKEIAAAGFTRVPAEGKDKKDNIRIIKLFANEGIEAMVADRRIYEAIKDPAGREKLLKEVVGDYREFENVKAYYITDEPSYNDFEALGDVCAVLNRLDPDREAYINLFPNYANSEQLGTSTYKKHVDLYADIVKPSIISYDHYHFVGRGLENKNAENESARDKLIRESAWNTSERAGFFDNIEIIRDKSLETKIPFMVIILLVEHGPYRNLSEAEIRWEVFQSLAYGSSRISYFTYGTPGYEENWRYINGMVNTEGRLTRHYYEVMRINRDLKLVGSYLAGKKSIGVYHIGEEKDKTVKYFDPSENLGNIADIRTTGGLTMGFFDSGEILIANKDYLGVNKIDITVGAMKRVSVMDKSTGEWYKLEKTDNVCTLTLMPGDGELIKIP
jgi:hypothetical protein